MATTKANQILSATTISVKQAVDSAIAEAQELYSAQNLLDLTLEEVEKSEDGKYWLITLGLSVPSETSEANLYAVLLGKNKPNTYQRKYKLFRVDTLSGKVVSMKIRSL